MLYRVETTSTGGMHEIVGITQVGPDSADVRIAILDEMELALVRSAVRGHLDLVGHESGPAVTIVDVCGEEVCAISVVEKVE